MQNDVSIMTNIKKRKTVSSMGNMQRVQFHPILVTSEDIRASKVFTIYKFDVLEVCTLNITNRNEINVYEVTRIEDHYESSYVIQLLCKRSRSP